MGLLQEIRDGALDDSKDLASVLRRCLVLAYKLDHEPLRAWVTQELDGYRSPQDVPEYRVIRTQLRGNFTNPRFLFSDHPVPMDIFTRDEIEPLMTARVTDAVSSLEKIKDRTDVRWSLPEGFESYVTSKLDHGNYCSEAWMVIPPGAISGILSSVRNRMLQYSLSLEAEYPDIEGASPGSPPVPKHELDQRFNVFILGTGHAITLGGGSGVVQNIKRQVVAGNSESLRAFLSSAGIPDEDVAALENVLPESTAADLADERSRLRRAIDAMVEKATKGGAEVVKTATRELILLSVRHYFGDAMGPAPGTGPTA